MAKTIRFLKHARLSGVVYRPGETLLVADTDAVLLTSQERAVVTTGAPSPRFVPEPDPILVDVDELAEALRGLGGGMAVVLHGSNAATPRPDAPAVYWVGTVAPANMTATDLYNGPSA